MSAINYGSSRRYAEAPIRGYLPLSMSRAATQWSYDITARARTSDTREALAQDVAFPGSGHANTRMVMSRQHNNVVGIGFTIFMFYNAVSNKVLSLLLHTDSANVQSKYIDRHGGNTSTSHH
jgi:hypothetical protein